ncbi:MAG: OmpH family outer membrane protein [Candidatus Omnitrophota bacterium]|nr:MAG: OmpH family outer membrane protein [Candidatus Omnitrophota bacterium]
MKKILICLAVLGLFMPFGAFSNNDVKIGYVNVFGVFDKYSKTKDYDKDLEKIKERKEESLDRKKDEIEKMQSKLNLLKPEEQEKKQKEVAEAIEDYRNLEREIYIDIKKDRDEKMKEILEDINLVVKDYAKKNKFDLIINENAVLYGTKVMDITSDILKIMNERYKK